MFRGWRRPLRASDPKILEAVVPEEHRLHRPRHVVARAAALEGGEHRDFTDCIVNRGEPYAPAEVGHRTATVSHIGNIAMRLGRKLQWDPIAERFLNDDEANRMLSRTQRAPWSVDNIDSWLG